MSDTNNIVKTGTTILGIVCKDGVVMAGDNRSSLGGQIIYNKNVIEFLTVAVNFCTILESDEQLSRTEWIDKMLKIRIIASCLLVNSSTKN